MDTENRDAQVNDEDDVVEGEVEQESQVQGRRGYSDGKVITGTAVGATRPIFVETGRGQTVEVVAGSPFGDTVERIAEEAHYGGYFRVFLNGEEILNPNEAPATIEPGMRIALSTYDKVGIH